MRLVDMGVPRYMVALSLQLVLAQRLVRVVCPHCSEPYVPTAHQSEWMRSLNGGADVDPTGLRHGRGCSHCNQTGAIGRTGVYEFLEVNQELVEAMNHGEPAQFTQAGRRQMGGHTLARDAIRLALEGRTTVEDAMHVSSQIED
jgi:MSHA biogenesis protein MshE